MSISFPQRGQPIDYDFISQIVNELIDLRTQVSPKSTDSRFDNGTNKVVTKTSQMIVVAANHKFMAQKETTNTTSSTKAFTYSFGTSFKYPPIVTITPVDTASTTSSKSANVTISSITETSVSGNVSFSTTGTSSVSLNIIAVGIPN